MKALALMILRPVLVKWLKERALNYPEAKTQQLAFEGAEAVARILKVQDAGAIALIAAQIAMKINQAEEDLLQQAVHGLDSLLK